MIIDDLISRLDVEAPVRDIRQGVFHTAVVTRRCGLAATLPRDALKQPGPMVGEAGSLLEKSAAELAAMARSGSQLEAAIGMAAINSLIDIDGIECETLNAADLLLEKGADRTVAVVGHFPFLPRLEQAARELWVIEKNPRPGDLEEDRADRFLPMADVVGITGSAFSNHTIERLLALCRPAAFVVVVGDTTPMSPLLFDYGVDALCGTRVVDNGLALRCVSQGANFRQIRGTRRIAMTRGRR